MRLVFFALYRLMFFITPPALRGNAMWLLSPQQGAFTLCLSADALSSKHAWVTIMIAGILRRVPVEDRSAVLEQARTVLRDEELQLTSPVSAAILVSIDTDERTINIEAPAKATV